MEMSSKSIVIFSLIVVGLFAVGLVYLIRENNYRKVTLTMVQEYVSESNSARKSALEGELKRRLEHRSVALTTRANFGSFEALVAQGQHCDITAKQQVVAAPQNTSQTYISLWEACMEQ
jgi:hypothetical protein